MPEALRLEIGKAKLARQNGGLREVIEGLIIEPCFSVGQAVVLKAEDLEASQAEFSRTPVMIPAEEFRRLFEMLGRPPAIAEIPLEDTHADETPACPVLMFVIAALEESPLEGVV